MKLRRISSCALVCALLSACASSARPASDLEWDPIQPVNRAFFSFNNGLDVVLIEPAAKGWRFVLREPGVRAVDRFFTNLEFPIRLVGNLLQLEISDCGRETARFVVNTTVGLLGFFDPATTRLGIKAHNEDIGQALGHYGLPAGPYLMIPILGPSNPRDFVTGFGDSALLGPLSIVRSTVGALNTRALYIDDIRDAKAASLDYYSFVRNAYVTTRDAQVRNLDPEQTKPNKDDLYEIEEDQEAEQEGDVPYSAVAGAVKGEEQP